MFSIHKIRPKHDHGNDFSPEQSGKHKKRLISLNEGQETPWTQKHKRSKADLDYRVCWWSENQREIYVYNQRTCVKKTKSTSSCRSNQLIKANEGRRRKTKGWNHPNPGIWTQLKANYVRIYRNYDKRTSSFTSWSAFLHASCLRIRN